MCICSYALNIERCSSVCFLECLRNDLLFQQLVCQSDGGIAPPPQFPHGDVLVSTTEIYQDIAGLLAIPDAVIGLLVNIFALLSLALSACLLSLLWKAFLSVQEHPKFTASITRIFMGT